MKTDKTLLLMNSKSGFTLFVSMIVASLLLAVGFSIGNIILKQLILSGSGKDSQIAFYAADSGAECAQFWDEKDVDGNTLTVESPFATSTDIAAANIKCGAGVVTVSKVVDSGVDAAFATSTLIIDYSSAISYYPLSSGEYKACANVIVFKGIDKSTGEDIPYTKITSKGYNAKKVTGGSSCETSNPRVVERGVLVQY